MNVFVACVLVTLITSVSPDIFTSSRKVERLLSEETMLLSTLQQYITDQYTQLGVISSQADLDLYTGLKRLSAFHEEKARTLQRRDVHIVKEEIKHPNGFYMAIKRLASEYIHNLEAHYDTFAGVARKAMGGFAEYSDVEGAKQSLLRLQNVYNLQPIDMANGNYLGFMGPQLDIEDMYQIAQQAFTSGQNNASIDWLLATFKLAHSRLPPADPKRVADILALMGRVNVFAGNIDTAEHLYKRAATVDPTGLEVAQLREELTTRPTLSEPMKTEQFQNFSRLCSMDKKIHTPFGNKPRIVCRYREGLLPYHRYKEEILAESPFASVIYDVITDAQSNFIRTFASNKLSRAVIGNVGVQSSVRISDTAWIFDWDHPEAYRISQRVKAITGLETQQRAMECGRSSAEALQVVNYGLGGHYDVHTDQYGDDDKGRLNEYVRDSGDRIATFLLYLTDVERGGATVFTRMGISVAPVKNMALLWYGHAPSMETEDIRTEHAGCPVLIGQKWIANKWIWTYGNTFRRRCGMTPDATQLDIEEDMKDHYGVPYETKLECE